MIMFDEQFGLEGQNDKPVDVTGNRVVDIPQILANLKINIPVGESEKALFYLEEDVLPEESGRYMRSMSILGVIGMVEEGKLVHKDLNETGEEFTRVTRHRSMALESIGFHSPRRGQMGESMKEAYQRILKANPDTVPLEIQKTLETPVIVEFQLLPHQRTDSWYMHRQTRVYPPLTPANITERSRSMLQEKFGLSVIQPS